MRVVTNVLMDVMMNDRTIVIPNGATTATMEVIMNVGMNDHDEHHDERLDERFGRR